MLAVYGNPIDWFPPPARYRRNPCFPPTKRGPLRAVNLVQRKELQELLQELLWQPTGRRRPRHDSVVESARPAVRLGLS